MTSRQGSPLREKAEWLLGFAEMPLATPREFRHLRREARRWLDPSGERPLEWGELRAVQAHIHKGLKTLRKKQPWEHAVQGTHVLLPGAKGLHGPLTRRFETRGPSDRCVINAMDVLTEVGDRLRTCKGHDCERTFIAVKRQEHCIDCAKAAQQARVTAWRRRNPQRVRDLAHETYVRRKRRETGRRNLKIARRPRKG